MIRPSFLKLSPEIPSKGRPSQTSLQVKSNSLRPTQSIAGLALRVSVGSTAAWAPTKPIRVEGRRALMVSATRQSLRSEGVDVLMITSSNPPATRRQSSMPMPIGAQSSRRDPGTKAAGWANHVGYQYDVTSRRA